MSMIIPAGVNKLQWSPKEDKAEEKEMVRTASVEGEAQAEVVDAEVEELDALAEAARAFLTTKQAESEESEDSKKSNCKKEGCEADADCDCKDGCEYCPECCYTNTDAEELIVKEAGEVDVSLGCGAEEAGTLGECDSLEHTTEEEVVIPEASGAAVIEVSEDVPEEGVAEVSEIEIAIDEVTEALEVVKEIVKDVTGEGETEPEVTEVSEVAPTEDADIPGVMDSENGEVETEKEGMQVMMSSDEEFCKFAKLSPQNRSKLSNYWVNMLGYPKDYVSLLTKDYEK